MFDPRQPQPEWRNLAITLVCAALAAALVLVWRL